MGLDHGCLLEMRSLSAQQQVALSCDDGGGGGGKDGDDGDGDDLRRGEGT